MPRIVWVEPTPDYRLAVYFDNAISVAFDLSQKVQATRFRQLLEPGLFMRARADGDRVYWNEFAELSVSELFELAQREKTG